MTGIYLNSSNDKDGSKISILVAIPSLELGDGATPPPGRVALCLAHNGAFSALAVGFDDRERSDWLYRSRKNGDCEFFTALIDDVLPFLPEPHQKIIAALKS